MARETELRCDTPQLCFNRGWGGGKHFFTQGHVGLDFYFFFIKKNLHLKTACCVYLCYL